MTERISLDGIWKFSIDEDKKGTELGYWKSAFNDSNWKSMEIPSNWYLQGLDYNGVVWFRLEFDLEFSDDDLIELIFQGVDYHAKVWINDTYLGAHEGYFGAFKFQITGKVLKKKNIISVRCCAPHDPGFPLNKKLFKGGLVHWDLRPGTTTLKGQEKGSGGIWQPVYLKIFKNISIDNVRISPRLHDDKVSAIIEFVLYNFEEKKSEVSIKLSIDPVNFDGISENYEEFLSLKPGSNSFSSIIEFQDPQLWWTWDLGLPNLYKLKIELFKNQNSFNQNDVIFGLRTLEEKENGWYLNEKPIFLRGSCYLASCWLSEMTPKKFEEDIRLVKEANMNILRNGYHVEPQIFYDVCDREGVLIWNDFPMLWDYDVSPPRIKEACRQMQELVLQFYNHPSLVIWCCHCEPMGANQLNLDISLKRTIEKYDKTNRVIMLRAHHKGHPFVGWYYSTYYNFLTLPGGKNPNEFGAQALPNANSKFWLDLGRDNWWPINDEWVYRDFQKLIMFYLAEVLKGHKGGITLKEFILKSQKYQAELLKFGLEAFRRGKGQIHGAILFTFSDAWPSITWSIVDYYRNPKQGFYAVQKAFQPLLCSIELPTVAVPNIPNIHLVLLNLREILIGPLKALSWSEYFTHNSRVKANLWIINDYNYSISNAKLKCQIQKNEKTLFSKTYLIDIQPSSSNYVKQIQFKFTKNMPYGEYLIKAEIYDNKGVKLSENDLTIFLDTLWKKVTKAFSRFFGILKGYLAALMGQEIQIKMLINAALKRYEKLAERSWCLDTDEA